LAALDLQELMVAKVVRSKAGRVAAFGVSPIGGDALNGWRWVVDNRMRD
jgi:hypothetical protein